MLQYLLKSLVEVEYDGQMYPGVLHAVDAHGMASIRCAGWDLNTFSKQSLMALSNSKFF